MRFTGRFKFEDFDSKGLKKTWDAGMQTQMKQAARAWLRAILTTELPRVPSKPGPPSIGIPPVWTGTARGTLTPLGKFLNVKVEIKPIAFRPGFGPDVGRGKGKFAFENDGKGVYRFRFSTQLVYMVLNEFNQSDLDLTHKTPWGGFKIGQKAFKNYVENVMPKRLPTIASAIRYQTRIVR